MAFMRPKTFWIAAAPVCVGYGFCRSISRHVEPMDFPFHIAWRRFHSGHVQHGKTTMLTTLKKQKTVHALVCRELRPSWISMSAAKKMVGFSIVVCSLFGILLIVIGAFRSLVLQYFRLSAAFAIWAARNYRLHAFRRFLVLVFLRFFSQSAELTGFKRIVLTGSL